MTHIKPKRPQTIRIMTIIKYHEIVDPTVQIIKTGYDSLSSSFQHDSSQTFGHVIAGPIQRQS